MVLFFRFLFAHFKNFKGFIDNITDNFTAVQPRVRIWAVEHQVEEVGALVSEKGLLNPGAEDRGLVYFLNDAVWLSNEANVRFAKGEDCGHVVIDV